MDQGGGARSSLGKFNLQIKVEIIVNHNLKMDPPRGSATEAQRREYWIKEMQSLVVHALTKEKDYERPNSVYEDELKNIKLKVETIAAMVNVLK
jgi:hypothetical protein